LSGSSPYQSVHCKKEKFDPEIQISYMRVIPLIEVRSQISYRAEIFLFPMRDFERLKKKKLWILPL
jgi:hypothetical protein